MCILVCRLLRTNIAAVAEPLVGIICDLESSCAVCLCACMYFTLKTPFSAYTYIVCYPTCKGSPESSSGNCKVLYWLVGIFGVQACKITPITSV